MSTYERKISRILNIIENVTICCPGFYRKIKGTCERNV